MKIVEKVFDLEDKTKKWIKNNRFKWYCIIFSIGMLLGLSSIHYINAPIRQGFLMGFGYGVFLILAELGAGGKGIE